MKKKLFFMGMSACALAFGLVVAGLTVAGCDGDSDDGGGENGVTLPASKGANALSGKTYVDWNEKIVFSETADDAASGTYKVLSVKKDSNWLPILVDGKYSYAETETGYYSWDETEKTVTLGPEKATWQDNNEYGPLQTKSVYRNSVIAMLDEYKEIMGDAEFNAELERQGFSSVSAYIDYAIAVKFKNVTSNYAFSFDGKALFLDEVLPDSNGSNELRGQTYYGMINDEIDKTKTYVFSSTGSTCSTYTQNGLSQTYNYAYDSTAKRVYLKVPTTDRDSRYDPSNTKAYNFADADEYNAAQANSGYKSVSVCLYDTTAKTLRY
jgi:hypothetical protein